MTPSARSANLIAGDGTKNGFETDVADSGAGIALLVTAVSLIISGFFPFVLRRLMVREEQGKQGN